MLPRLYYVTWKLLASFSNESLLKIYKFAVYCIYNQESQLYKASPIFTDTIFFVQGKHNFLK